jgi:NAD(P)-dependent dehydrogenase (short-subunit alcohol dehydrogenase family)
MELRGKVALVTGASRSIGKATAVALAGRGADVVVSARTMDPGGPIAGSLAETVAAVTEAGAEALAVRADLTDTDQVASLAEEAAAWKGRIDIVVNNAAFLGRPMYQNLDELSLTNWTRQLTVNLTAPFILSKTLVDGMRSTGGGAIVNITSGAWLMAEGTVPGITYGPTKAALNRLTIALARDLRPDGIVVVALNPGFTRTELAEAHSWEAGIDIATAHDPEVPAADVVWLLEQEPATVSGKVFDTVGGGRPELVVDGTATEARP